MQNIMDLTKMTTSTPKWLLLFIETPIIRANLQGLSYGISFDGNGHQSLLAVKRPRQNSSGDQHRGGGVELIIVKLQGIGYSAEDKRHVGALIFAFCSHRTAMGLPVAFEVLLADFPACKLQNVQSPTSFLKP
jgi:hypothetical protein